MTLSKEPSLAAGAAEKLSGVTSQVKAKASEPGRVAPDKVVAGRAANLTSTARYLRDQDMNALIKDIRSFVSQNPGAALLGVGVIGFLLGRAFSSRD